MLKEQLVGSNLHFAVHSQRMQPSASVSSPQDAVPCPTLPLIHPMLKWPPPCSLSGRKQVFKCSPGSCWHPPSQLLKKQPLASLKPIS